MSKTTSERSGKRKSDDSESADESLPPEIEESCEKFFRQLVSLEKLLQPLFSSDLTQLEQSLSPEKQATLKLLQLYGVNSLFFSYLRLSGQEPETHDIQHELERIKKYINQLREIGSKHKRPHVDREVAKRLVKAGIPRGGRGKRGKKMGK